jgi:OFA family oxalate/formate antiporter-like MFS transporter
MNNRKRWGYLIAGTIMLLFVGMIYGWTIFRDPLAVIFGIETSDARLALPFTISIIGFCVGGFIGSKLTERIKNRFVVLIGGALVFAGFFSLSFVLRQADAETSYIALDILYGVFVGLGVGLSYNATLSALTPWFPGHTGFASGILMLGFGVGAIMFASVVQALNDMIGIYTTFAVLGIAIAVVLGIGSFFTKKPEQGVISSGNEDNVSVGVSTTQPNAIPTKDYPLRETVRTPVFWILFVWFVIVSSGGLLVIGSAAQIANSFGSVALLGLIVSVFNGVGRPLIGTLADKLGRARTMYINSSVMILGGVMLVSGAATGNAVFIIVGLPLIGISYGGVPALISTTATSFFGTRYFAVNFAAGSICLAPAAIMGPLIAAKLQTASGGSYDTSFYLLVAFAVAALLLSLLLTAVARKRGME